MIGYIKGKIIDIIGDSIIVENNGIGWDVRVGFQEVLIGQEIELFIHTQMRESEITLWGFKSPLELKLFRLLISISGVGGRTAMAILKERGVNGIVDAVLKNDAKLLKVSGVGAKTSQKIIIEIKDKINNLNIIVESGIEEPSLNINLNEAIEALESLGYRNSDIMNAVNKIEKEILKDLNVQEIVKTILRVI